MSQIEWKTGYCIGHFQIDQEHQALVSLANKIIRFSNSGVQVDKIKDALKALNDYTKFHFRSEENYMQRTGYRGLEHHKSCHAGLIERMNNLIGMSDSTDHLVHQLKRLMVVWVIEHIIHEDRKIALDQAGGRP
jgi:hemerythrin